MSARKVPAQGVIRVEVPANLPPNSTIQADIQVDEREGFFTFQQVPASEAWVIEDVFVTSTPSIDISLYFFKNRLQQIAKVGPMSTRLVSNPSRPPTAPMVYGPTSILTVQAVNLVAGGASPTTLLIHFIFSRIVAG